MAARCSECMNEAVERCEVTGVPLCAGCLWYTGDGRRISERVARRLAEQNVAVYPPKAYLDQLGVVMELPRLPAAPPLPLRAHNGNDLIALIAGAGGIISIATCFGIGFTVCAPPLPLIPLLLGVIGLSGAKNANKPHQARLMSWLGIAGGAGFVALMLLLLVGSVAFGTPNILTIFFSAPSAP